MTSEYDIGARAAQSFVKAALTLCRRKAVLFSAVHVYDDESARIFFFFDAFQKFVALPQNTRPRVGRGCSRFAVKARAFDGKGAA